MRRFAGVLCAAAMLCLPAFAFAQEDGGSDDAGIPVPSEWYCDPDYYGTEDGCDCGCGVVDPDCGGAGCATVGCEDTACEFCYDAEGNFATCPGSGGTDAGTTGTDSGTTGTDAGTTTGTDANTGGGGGGGDDTDDTDDDSGMCSGVPAGNAAALFGLGLVALLALRRRR